MSGSLPETIRNTLAPYNTLFWTNDIEGPPGPAGSPGGTGPTGPTGAAGVPGSATNTGATGPLGPTGADGATGLPGTASATGATGPIGPTGAEGPTGLPGSATNTGATGPVGTPGSTGAAGSTGPQGSQGFGLPSGGTTNQVLTKNSNTDFDASWQTSFAYGSHVGVTDINGNIAVPHGLGYGPSVVVAMSGDANAVAGKNIVFSIVAGSNNTFFYLRAGLGNTGVVANTLMRINWFAK